MEQTGRTNNKSLGKAGEEAAARHLEEQGMRIIECNYRCGRMGEIDIIARDAEYICFIEVKTRTGNLYGTPGEAVDGRKQATIRRLAWTYMKKLNLTESKVRFDVAEVMGRKTSDGFKVEEVNFIKDAF